MFTGVSKNPRVHGEGWGNEVYFILRLSSGGYFYLKIQAEVINPKNPQVEVLNS